MRDRIWTWVVVAALAATSAGCGGTPKEAETANASPGAAPAAAPAGNAAYPPIYRGLSLPELDGATLTSTGRQTTSLRDGLALTLTSTRTVDQMRDSYREAMTKLGWTEERAGRGAMVPNLPVANVSFVKDTLWFSATMTAVGPENTRIDIRVLER
jgi:hypothetical protein